jgi:mannose/fructose/N-acetylgalactosamine-specific phosphotransferase system component IIC
MASRILSVLLCIGIATVAADCDAQVRKLEEKVESLEAQLHEAQHQLHFSNWGTKMAEHATEFSSNAGEHVTTSMNSCSAWSKAAAMAVRDEAAKIKTAEDLYKVPLAAAEPHLVTLRAFYESELEPVVGPVVSQVQAATGDFVTKVTTEFVPVAQKAIDEGMVQFLAVRKSTVKEIKNLAPQVAPHASKIFDGVLGAIGSVLVIMMLPSFFSLCLFLLKLVLKIAYGIVYVGTLGCFCSCLCSKRKKAKAKGPAANASKKQQQKKGKQDMGFSSSKKKR